MTPIWLDGFFTINFINESDRRPIPDADFRKNGMLTFYQIMTLCNSSKEMTERSKAFFLFEEYFQTTALSREFINTLYMFETMIFSFFLLKNIPLSQLRLGPIDLKLLNIRNRISSVIRVLYNESH